ncbi:oligosaccharide flippase family protein [Mucilaginibacter sp. BJC16-A38]|uniref:oligosaccharide flippase family protein n=1 Tax=Mucilaginibacter phenanthrenivorans TaxID=1234842 RepID=UPI00215766A3|nr:oligosaccharide flippase family protein [Mucilaginibacter phenanthrenivorans]MCR8560151.1 oligosaccharide flippase family protein [Mucilaginibacter phenanthrenivorans]
MEGKKKLVLLNVITSGGQVVLIGLVYLFLYRYLLSRLGVEVLGVWSVVLSTSSLATLANFGIADSVVRFVALFIKEKDTKKMEQLVFTASLFLLGLFIVIAAIIYPCADLILKAVLPAKFIKEGLLILPYSLTCLIINSVNGVYASVLDGMQKNYIRNGIFTVSSLVLLVATYFFVPVYHLKGVAFAQVIQSVFALVFCLLTVIYHVKYNPLKWNWSKAIFKQIFNYGMKFQFVSLAAMLNDPITKILLGRFGGMAFAGYYEMANRLLMQARGIIVSATQSLVPVMVGLNKDEIPAFYKKIFSNVLFFSLAIMSIIIISGKLISFYWIGSYQPVFCNTLFILGLSLIFNILNGPAYFYYMADGNLNILIKTHFILGLLNLALSYCFGYFFGGYGVVCGWFLAVLLGSFYLLFTFNKMYNLKMRMLFQKQDIYFLFFLIIVTAFNKLYKPTVDFRISDVTCVVLVAIYVIYLFFKHKVNSIRVSVDN